MRYATAYDYEGFWDNEISLRRDAMYPPFSKIVRVLVTSEDNDKAIETLREIYGPMEELYRQNMDKFLFFNKMAAPIKKIQDKYRYQVLMRMTDGALLKKIYDICSAATRREVSVTVEENPVNLS